MSTRVFAEPGWDAILRRDADAYFAGGAGLSDVQRHEGRAAHFSYRPEPDRPRLFVRRYRHGGRAAFLGGRYPGDGRLRREMDLLRALSARGLSVPRVAGGVVRGCCLCELALVTEQIENAVTLLEWIRRRPGAEAVRRVARAVRRLADAGVAHPDLNARNLLIRGEEVWFVDFDGAGFGDPSGLVPRLYRSLEKRRPEGYSVARADRWRFVLEFAGEPDRARRIARRCDAELRLHRIGWNLFGR
jgi:hypothetical protein